MKLKKTIDKLNQLYKLYWDVEVICASDDEGNEFNPTAYLPNVMYTEKVEKDMQVRTELDILENSEDKNDFLKVVCIN